MWNDRNGIEQNRTASICLSHVSTLMYLFALICLMLPVFSTVQIYGNLTLKSFVVLSDFFFF